MLVETVLTIEFYTQKNHRMSPLYLVFVHSVGTEFIDTYYLTKKIKLNNNFKTLKNIECNKKLTLPKSQCQ